MKKSVALFIIIALSLLSYLQNDTPDQDPYLMTDYSRLHPVKVERVIKGKEEDQLVSLVHQAREHNWTISIAGRRHSQGGHTYYKDGIVVDMTAYNQVIAFDPKEKWIRIQSGATWKDLQDVINPYSLSVKTMQSQSIFTIGGSISINAHGRDIRNGSLIKSVESFRLLTADGQIKDVSRTNNAELFPLALGGFGLFGIILDVTLILTDNELYEMTSEKMTVSAYADYFQKKIHESPDIHMHIARISVAPDSFLRDMYAINYAKSNTPLQGYDQLKTRESWVIPSKILFNLNRSFDWSKNTFWHIQSLYASKLNGQFISRNNAMRSESEFMEYRSAGNNDLLQEYFIPTSKFADFIEDLKIILPKEDLNLLNISVRYVDQDQEAALSYAKEDMFALVCLFQVPLADKEQQKIKTSIGHILDAVIKHDGTYYLPYAAYPSLEQFQTVYTAHDLFFTKKNEYDANHVFMNYFFENYKGGSAE